MTAVAFRRALTEGREKGLVAVRRGIEKEGLRVSAHTHRLSQVKHPEVLGSALTHGSITTDYSEALVEFITGVHETPRAALEELEHLHVFTAQSIPDEFIWGASMPPELGSESEIPIADYGSSNTGMMKRVYRNGLGARYGRTMQVIAGIHYNFSLPEKFWESSLESSESKVTLKDWRTDGYLALIRNFQRHGWLLNFLTGSSPALSRSFVGSETPAHLRLSAARTLFSQYATSLRMGDLGYTSSAQDSLQICYNRLDTYIETLTQAIIQPYDDYKSLSTPSTKERQQLNDGLLQIENEFYSAIRPKRVTQSGEAPVRALDDRGIEYVEVRCLDVNPFTALGIDEATIALVDSFLLSCVMTESPLCTDASRKRDNTNTQNILNQGRNPSLSILNEEGRAVPMREAAKAILTKMSEAAAWLDETNNTRQHSEAVLAAHAQINGDTETLSARMLRELEERRVDYSVLISEYSQSWNQQFKNRSLPSNIMRQLTEEAATSLRKQLDVEASDQLTFDEFLQQFYAQYTPQKG